jgi:chitin disaccharide deacetylase
MDITEGRDLRRGAIIVNADDWGRDCKNTDRILDCVTKHTVSSVSAMVFMIDSERAAGLAQEYGIDTGLHINFTSAFSTPYCNPKLQAHQAKLAKCLTSSRLAKALYHPGLTESFDYVLRSQIAEYERLYGVQPARMDGHHHMHLCPNVLMGGLLPAGTIVRRSFSFLRGEKSAANLCWRSFINSILARRYRITDFFFSLPPLSPIRLKTIGRLASSSVVEVETHPVDSEEYGFLNSGAFSQWKEALELASFSRCFN